MAARTIELDRKDLDKSIEVLSSAGQALQLSHFESSTYHMLMVSADVATVSFVGFFVAVGVATAFDVEQFPKWAQMLIGFVAIVSIVSILVGIVSLALNIPLFVRVFREKARLKALGLSSLSKSLWVESRRSRWIIRARGLLLIVIGAWLFLLAAGLLSGAKFSQAEDRVIFYWASLSLAIIGGFLLAAQYLRTQRERLALTANAAELRKALQNLRRRAGDAEVVTVPSELLEQTAKIESAQIARERREAVLRSIASPSNDYAVAFDRDTIAQRTALDIADRIELEDLVDQIGARAAERGSQETVSGTGSATLRAATKNKQVEIDYVIDNASRRVRIVAVRPGATGSSTSPHGAGNA